MIEKIPSFYIQTGRYIFAICTLYSRFPNSCPSLLHSWYINISRIDNAYRSIGNLLFILYVCRLTTNMYDIRIGFNLNI